MRFARSEADSFAYRRNFIRAYLERKVAHSDRAQTLERLWTMLAHNQAGLLNAPRLAANLRSARRA
ncbi:hypothetical protein MPLB_2420035 [Mesorhizobium sp. ORS 3324]|nr:hypothetical protein MPLB_2420035 [Mesorhizobium sp. ORS 3324]